MEGVYQGAACYLLPGGPPGPPAATVVAASLTFALRAHLRLGQILGSRPKSALNSGPPFASEIDDSTCGSPPSPNLDLGRASTKFQEGHSFELPLLHIILILFTPFCSFLTRSTVEG